MFFILIKIVNIIFAYIVVRFIDFFFVEGFIKPTIANWGKRTFKKFLPILYDITDDTVLKLINEKDKDKIINYIRENIFLLAPDLSEKESEYLLNQWQKKFDILTAIAKHNQ